MSDYIYQGGASTSSSTVQNILKKFEGIIKIPSKQAKCDTVVISLILFHLMFSKARQNERANKRNVEYPTNSILRRYIFHL